MLRWAFFYLFLFAIGYSVGPQFFGSLKKEALAADCAGAGRRRQRPGHRDRLSPRRSASTRALAVGLLSGGMTQSAALGTGAQRDRRIADSRGREDHADGQRAARRTRLPTGSAIFGLILFLTWLGPKIMRADLKREAKALESKLSGGKRAADCFPPLTTACAPIASRARTSRRSNVAALEERYAAERGCPCSGCDAAASC